MLILKSLMRSFVMLNGFVLFIDLGHSWTREISESWGCFLQRGRLLCSSL